MGSPQPIREQEKQKRMKQVSRLRKHWRTKVCQMRRKQWRMQLTLLRISVSKRPQSMMMHLRELSTTKKIHRRDTNRLPMNSNGTLTPSSSKPSKRLKDLRICISPTRCGINEQHKWMIETIPEIIYLSKEDR